MNTKVSKQPFILIIYGPTGVGKTDIALSIASDVPSEIINMDVGQFYTPFSIGTAKPDWQHEPTPHHLFDIINEPKSYTVVEYRKVLHKKIQEIIGRGNLPILVGGSGFYLHAMLFPPHEKADCREKSYNEAHNNTWDTLYAIDPERALKIDKNDIYRIERALEIWKKTNCMPSSLTPHYSPLADFLLLYVIRDTPDLNQRINERVIAMINHGWIEETQKLLGTPWQDFIQHKKLIGYNEICAYLQGKKAEASLHHMIEIIKNKTRQYAKRQRTFWRKLEREINNQYSYTGNTIGCIETLNLTNTNLQLYINELLKRLSYIGRKK